MNIPHETLEGEGTEYPDYSGLCAVEGCDLLAMYAPEIRVWPDQQKRALRLCAAIIRPCICFCSRHRSTFSVNDLAADFCDPMNKSLKKKGMVPADPKTAELTWFPIVTLPKEKGPAEEPGLD